MKEFIVKIFIYLIILAIAYNIKPMYLMITEKYKNKVAGREIYHSIKKSKHKNTKCKILIIGDSVGKQLFDNYTYNDSINSLACNQAISMVGQFILLNNYLINNNQVDKVILIYTPGSFKNNLDQVYTFHYFLKPFCKKEYFKYFSETVFEQIKKIPKYFLCRLPSILTTNWAPDFESKDKINYTFLSPISIEYLKKIKQLSEQYNFEFRILPTPSKNSNKNKIENINMKEIIDNGFYDYFYDYFNNIIYLDDSCFIDNVHLKHPEIYTEIYKTKWIK